MSVRHMLATSLPASMALFVLAAGCADSTLTTADAGATADAGSSSPDAGRRVKPRTVPLNLPKIATREVTEGPDGNPALGPIEPLDGADVCIVRKRPAFTDFEPFEVLEEPICVKSVAEEGVHFEDAPGTSDLVITIEYPGLRPLVVTNRTNDFGAEAFWMPVLSLIVLPPGAFDPWLEPAGRLADDQGALHTGLGFQWAGPGHAREEVLPPPNADVLFGPWPWAIAVGFPETIEPAGGADAIETVTTSRWRVHAMPEGSARVTYTLNEHVNCLPTGLLGLRLPGEADAATVSFEIPVLAGYDHFAAEPCGCGGNSDDDELIDLATCQIAEGAADADADAGGL